MEKSDFRKPGEKENERLLVRLTKTQKLRLRMLADASGYKTMSNFVRISLLNPAVDEKLNEILRIVREIQEKVNKCI